MKYICFLISLLMVNAVFAQSKIPVIKATSKFVAINDDGYLDKNVWTLSPKARPDIFTADRTRKAKWVIFYTDIDSIKVKVKPGSTFDFIVLLNGKDSCYTRIVSAIPAKALEKSSIPTNDTIPFTLTAFNAIQVKSVINDTDTLNLHFDVGSFDFHFTKDAIIKKTKLLSNQPDALAGKVNPNYNNLGKILKLQMGTLVWHNPDIMPTTLTAHDMDGRFGWNLFEGKIVELDYDHGLLIIHSGLPKALKGYVKSTIKFTRSFVCVKGSFKIANKKYTGSFLFDTGSDQAIIVDSNWALQQNFPKNLPLIKSSILHDPRGAKYETNTVQVPFFKINGFELTHIPTLMLGSKSPLDFQVNYLGNDLLKRFNIILDFKNDCMYMKPNTLFGLKYREST